MGAVGGQGRDVLLGVGAGGDEQGGDDGLELVARAALLPAQFHFRLRCVLDLFGGGVLDLGIIKALGPLVLLVGDDDAATGEGGVDKGGALAHDCLSIGISDAGADHATWAIC